MTATRFKQVAGREVFGQKQFIAWDGEGWRDESGHSHYMLLMNSKGARINAPQLSTDQCLAMMLAESRRYGKGAIHIIYGGNYDIANILRDVPEEKRLELKATNHVSFWIAEHRYTVEYIPSKWFEIRGFDWENHEWGYIKVFDIMTFFQSSFIKALESRNIAVSEEIVSGKGNRNLFDYSDLEEIASYCSEELAALVELADTLREEFEDAGINVTQWHGPGAVASATFKKYRVREHLITPPPAVIEASRYAYFGGHFEQFQGGHHDGRVYVYDIRSAYPDALRQLPSLANAEWYWSDKFLPDQWGVWDCGYERDDNDIYAPNPIPYRGKDDTVGFPALNERVWLWSAEARLATAVHGGWVLDIKNDRRPFAYIEDMFLTRAEWKRQGRGGERALKLSMNSAYGKLAQRIGGKPGQAPYWHNLTYAGLVTSLARAKLWAAMKQKPHAIIGVETDSVLSTEPLNLDIGESLGQWEESRYEWITYIQSGIYYTSEGVRAKTKTRGINPNTLDGSREAEGGLSHAKVLQWLAAGAADKITVPTRMFNGLSSAHPDRYCEWDDDVKRINLAGGKRIHHPETCSACIAGASFLDRLHPLRPNPTYQGPASYPHRLPWMGPTNLDDDEIPLAPEIVVGWERRK